MTTDTTPLIITNLTNSKANIVLDASKIDLFETCPQRYNIRHNLNKTKPGKAEALDKGSLLHEGFEIYYKALASGMHYNDRMQVCLMKIREKSSDPDSSFLESSDVDVILSAAEQSLDYWRVEDENNLEVLAVETPFAYVLYEDELIRIIITGKIDLLCNFKAIGRGSNYTNLPIDHKSFSRDSPVHRKSNQFINYCTAVNSNYLIVNRVGLQKTVKAEDKFKRIPLSYDPLYIADWKSNLIKVILGEYLGCVAENYWPEKPTSCNKFNRLCEYYEICDSSGDDTKKFKLENNYIDTEVWDVTAKMKE